MTSKPLIMAFSYVDDNAVIAIIHTLYPSLLKQWQRDTVVSD